MTLSKEEAEAWATWWLTEAELTDAQVDEVMDMVIVEDGQGGYTLNEQELDYIMDRAKEMKQGG